MPEVVNTSALTVEDETAEIEDNRPVMIDVDHVSMSFNMASEQLNNLKEYAIAIARGKLFFEEFKALDDVSFKVRKGDVFGIMGTNGSGKSTILKIIAGVLEPTKGKCTVNGNIAPLIELGAGFDMDLSARENIYLNGALLGYSKRFIDEHFQEIVEFAEVEKFLDMPLKNYSSGMVARIAFAIATVIVPEILVVDEVLSVGDFMFQKKCEDRITQLIEEYGVTVLIVSHSNDQIARLCNKAVWIEKGHVRLSGSADDVARIYGALGGRTGSKEAEQRIFEAMRASSNFDVDRGHCSSVFGENASAACSQLVMRAWKNEQSDTVVLAVDNTHANAVVANGIAGALGAPLLPLGSNGLQDSVRLALMALLPNRVIIIDAGGVFGDCSDTFDFLSTVPEIIYFGNKPLLDVSLEVIEFGNTEGIWHESLFVTTFENSFESLAAAPWIYSEKAPVLIGDACDELRRLNLVNDLPSNCCRCFVIGRVRDEWKFVLESLPNASIDMIGVFETGLACAEIGAKTCEIFADHSILAGCIFGSITSSQWPQLLSCGCVGGKLGMPLYLFNDTNLDSESVALDFAGALKGRIPEVIFVGDGAGLGQIEKDLVAFKCFADE